MVLVDGHVHIYECFEPGAVFDAAADNFAAAAHGLRHERDYAAVLCLVESRHERFLDRVRSGVEGRTWRGRRGYWELEQTAEPEALVVQCGSRRLCLCAGRQLVTRERLEVLALGTTAPLPDGEPIDATLQSVRDVGAVAVLPWGVGKWLGARGTVLARVLEDPRFRHVCLGDNGNRLELGPEPRQFVVARRVGRRVLPGSDPLPLPGEEVRAGSYGFAIDVPLDPRRPAAALLALLGSGLAVTAFGRRTPLTRFVGRQLKLKWKSHLARAA